MYVNGRSYSILGKWRHAYVYTGPPASTREEIDKGGPDEKGQSTLPLRFIHSAYKQSGFFDAEYTLLPGLLLILAALTLIARIIIILVAYQFRMPLGLLEDTKARLEAVSASPAEPAAEAGRLVIERRNKRRMSSTCWSSTSSRSWRYSLWRHWIWCHSLWCYICYRLWCHLCNRDGMNSNFS